MKLSLLVLQTCSLISIGCSTATPKGAPTETPATAATSDAPMSDSQVLRKNKCPKNSKYVNGKCMLQVESDDE